MKGFIENIEKLTKENDLYRKVLYTAKDMQLTVMSLKPGEEIGTEVHNNIAQFIRIEAGTGEVIIDGVSSKVKDDFAVIIPAGAEHNVINTGDVDMKLYSIYSPPEHKEGIIHETKADETHEHFDGTTTE